MKSLVVAAVVTTYLFNGEDPQQVLDTQYQAYVAVQTVNPTGIEEYRQKILDNTKHIPKAAQRFLDTSVDWEVYAASIFRPNWDKLTETQKEGFKRVLQRDAIDRYGDLFSPSMKFSVMFNGDTQYKILRGRRFAKVSTTISSLKSDTEVEVDFIFHLGPERWALSDIYVDGVSKSRTYRHSVRRIYKKEGYVGVIKAFTKKR